MTLFNCLVQCCIGQFSRAFCGHIPGAGECDPVWVFLLSSPLLSPLLMFPSPESDLAWWSPQPSALAWLGLGQSCRSQVFISLELELLLREETVTFIPPRHIPPDLMSCQRRSGHISTNFIQGRIELCRNMYPIQYFSNNKNNALSLDEQVTKEQGHHAVENGNSSEKQKISIHVNLDP